MKRLLTRHAPILVLGLIGLATAILAISPVLHRTHASPSTFCYDQTNSATTSLNYLSAGAGTTTLAISNCFDRSILLNSALLTGEYTASSSAPVLVARVEQSLNGIDWFPISATLNTSATTTLLSTISNYQWALSTTTDSGGSGTPNRVHFSVPLSIYAPYLRVIFSVPTGGTNGGLWAQIIGRRELP